MIKNRQMAECLVREISHRLHLLEEIQEDNVIITNVVKSAFDLIGLLVDELEMKPPR